MRSLSGKCELLRRLRSWSFEDNCVTRLEPLNEESFWWGLGNQSMPVSPKGNHVGIDGKLDHPGCAAFSAGVVGFRDQFAECQQFLFRLMSCFHGAILGRARADAMGCNPTITSWC